MPARDYKSIVVVVYDVELHQNEKEMLYEEKKKNITFGEHNETEIQPMSFWLFDKCVHEIHM